jgi:hypothetical protein
MPGPRTARPRCATVLLGGRNEKNSSEQEEVTPKIHQQKQELPRLAKNRARSSAAADRSSAKVAADFIARLPCISAPARSAHHGPLFHRLPLARITNLFGELASSLTPPDLQLSIRLAALAVAKQIVRCRPRAADAGRLAKTRRTA